MTKGCLLVVGVGLFLLAAGCAPRAKDDTPAKTEGNAPAPPKSLAPPEEPTSSAPPKNSAPDLAALRRIASSDDAESAEEALFHGIARTAVIQNVQPNKLRIGGARFRVKRNPWATGGAFVYDPKAVHNGATRNLVWWVRSEEEANAARARAIVMEVERKLGFEPTDREFEKLGYDIESRVPDTGKLRFIEVKGRVSGAATIIVTRNEILYSLNKPEDFILGIVEFVDGIDHRVHYVRQPFQREPDFGVTSVNYDFTELLARAGKPS